MVFQGAKVRQLKVFLVANRHPGQVPGPWIEPVVVSGKFDAADDYIVDHLRAGDVVITGDIPLAGRAIERGAIVLSMRGELMDQANIGEKLAMRNLMQELRSGGQITGGPLPWNPQDKKRFADGMDRLLTKLRQDYQTRLAKST